MTTLETHVVLNPSVNQMRCATQVVSKRNVEGGTEYELLYSGDIAREVLSDEIPAYRPTVIG